MLYASAAFLFLFLPLTLGVYMLVSERTKRHVLLFSGLLFYILANLACPLAILVFAVVFVITYFAGRRVAKTGSRALTWCVVFADIAAFAVLRLLWSTLM